MRKRTDIDAVRRDIDERGAQIAYEALLEVCRDPKAQAQAKAAAGVAVLRAGGLYDAKRRQMMEEDSNTMTSAELRQALAEAGRLDAIVADTRRILEAHGDEDYEDDEPGPDIFA